MPNRSQMNAMFESYIDTEVLLISSHFFEVEELLNERCAKIVQFSAK